MVGNGPTTPCKYSRKGCASVYRYSMDRGILRDERNLVVTVIRLVKNPKCRCVFFWNLRVPPPMSRPPQERRGLFITINHYDPISKALFRGWGWHWRVAIRFPSDEAAPFPALEKMNFLRVLFRKKRALLPQFCWKASSNCGIYTSWSWNLLACFNCKMMTCGGGGGCPKKTLIYRYI